MLRQLLAATLCALLVAPAYPSESTLPRSSSTPSHTYDAKTLSKTRVWGSNEKILLHFRATLLLSEKQHWGYAKCSWKNVVGSVVTYDYDAFGNLVHSSTTLSTPTPNNYLFAGEQYDPDLSLYYNRARYLNVSTGKFWSMDTFEGDDESPLSLHKYLYSYGDPIDVVDPSGHDGADLATIAFVAGVALATLDAINFIQNMTVRNGVSLAIDVVLIPEVVVKAVTAVAGVERATQLIRGIYTSTRALTIASSEGRAVQYWAGLGITVAARGETALKAIGQGGKAADLILQTTLDAPVILSEAKSTLSSARLEESLVDNGGKFVNTISALQNAGSDYKGVQRIVITYEQLGNLGKDWQVLGDGYVRYRGAIQYVNGIPVEAVQIAH